MISAVFVDRPRLAIVIAIIMTLAGLIAMTRIPVAQFPDIVPPQVHGDDTLSRRLGGGGGSDRRPAAGGAGQRRRPDDVHEVQQRQRRQLFADGQLRARHQPRHRRGQRQQPRAGGTAEDAGGGAAAGRDGAEAQSPRSWSSCSSTARAASRTRCSSATTSPSTCSTGCRACRASGRRTCSARSTTPCASGSTPTGWSALEPDAVRHHQRHPAAERAGRGRAHRRAANHRRHAVPDQPADQGAAGHAQRNSATSSCAPIRTASVLRVGDVARVELGAATQDTLEPA